MGKISPITIKPDYKPRPEQRIIHDDKHQFKVVVAHRRLGKTTCALMEIIKGALENNGKRYWFIAPTYRQAKMIANRDLRKHLPPQYIERKNENDLTWELINGSEIALKGAESSDALRGAGLAGLVLDEVQQMDREVWEAVLKPMLAEEQGWAIFLGTPQGRNHFYELYQRGLDDEFPNWKSFHWAITDTKVFSKEFVEQERKENTEEYFRQEWMAEFLEGSGTVFRGAKEVMSADLPEGGLFPKWDETYQMGVDLARLQDWTVLTVVNQKLEVVYWERFQQLDWEMQKLKILHISDVYHHCPVQLDTTGLGDPIYEDLLRMGGNVRGFKFSSTSKKALIENLQLRIEQRQIKIPNNKQIVKELESFRFEITENGRVKYSAPSGFHDDCIMSLALSIWDLIPSLQPRINQSRYLPYEQDF